jgi:hypothetical protein
VATWVAALTSAYDGRLYGLSIGGQRPPDQLASDVLAELDTARYGQ